MLHPHRSFFRKCRSFIRTSQTHMEKKERNYLKTYKESAIENHVSKFAVENAKICEGSSRFYNNSSESINAMLRSWMGGKADLERFVLEYESFIRNQES